MSPPNTPPLPVPIVLELLTYYSLEADRHPKSASKVNVLSQWLQHYPEEWVKLALVESLYQGRYKMISVEQLLALWDRRGQPTYHFSHEFEALVCHNVPHQMEQAVTFPQSGVEQPQLSSINTRDAEASASTSRNARVQLPAKQPQTAADEKTELTPAARSQVSQPKVSAERKAASDLKKPLEPSVFGAYHLLPVTLSRIGLEPIQQFTPEAAPAEFCKRLEAIARTRS